MTAFSLRTCAGIVNALRTAEGRIVPRAELIETLWPNPDDEPTHPGAYIDQNVWVLRHKFGFPIVTEYGRGIRFQPQECSALRGAMGDA